MEGERQDWPHPFPSATGAEDETFPSLPGQPLRDVGAAPGQLSGPRCTSMSQ